MRRAAAGREARILASRSQTLPPGSYKQVCRGCALEREGTVLACSRCPKYARGGMTRGRAVVPVSLCGAFGYRDGRLICDKAAGLAKLPHGSYKDTCAGCHVAGAWLWCRFCKGSAGVDTTGVKVAYRTCRGDIGNLGGNLVCTEMQQVRADPQDGHRLPPGSYAETCRGCRILDRETERLSCSECWSKSTGELTASWISTQHCHRFRNNNGRLECEAPHEWDRYGNVLQPAADGRKEEGHETEVAEEEEAGGCADDAKEDEEEEHEDLSGAVEPPSGMPRGSYMDTCHGCRLSDDNTVLTCSACAGQSGPSTVSIDVGDCHYIYNEQGTLRCFSYGNEEEGGGHALAQDELTEDARVHGVDPVARGFSSGPSVRDGSGVRVATRTQRKRAATPPADMPEGSYMETCHGCRMNEDKTLLTCSACAGQKGHDEKSIEVGDCHFIYSEGGDLRCFSYGHGDHREDNSRDDLSSYDGKHHDL